MERVLKDILSHSSKEHLLEIKKNIQTSINSNCKLTERKDDFKNALVLVNRALVWHGKGKYRAELYANNSQIFNMLQRRKRAFYKEFIDNGEKHLSALKMSEIKIREICAEWFLNNASQVYKDE